MKIQKKDVGVDRYVLFAGDTVTAGITHHIKISGEDSWVKYEVSTKVQESESSEDTAMRAIGHVNANVMEAVKTTVNTVNGVGR